MCVVAASATGTKCTMAADAKSSLQDYESQEHRMSGIGDLWLCVLVECCCNHNLYACISINLYTRIIFTGCKSTPVISRPPDLGPQFNGLRAGIPRL